MRVEARRLLEVFSHDENDWQPQEEMRDASVRRPTLPVMLFVALGAWAGCAGAYIALEGVALHACVACGVVACLLAIGCAYGVARCGMVWIVACLLGVCCGVASSALHAALLVKNQALLEQEFTTRMSVLLLEDSHESTFGSSCLARVTTQEGHVFVVRAYLPSNVDVGCWSMFEAQGALKLPREQQAHALWMDGCVGVASFSRIHAQEPQGLLGAMVSLRKRALEPYQAQASDGALLLESMTFAYRQRLFTHSLYADVKAAGLAHVVAVSGAHLAAVAGLLMLLARLFRMPRALALALHVLLLGCYLLLTGAPLSAMRAATMVFCAAGAFYVSRRNWPAHALALCIFAFCILWPEASMSLSFVLSAFATLSILLFSRYFAWWVHAACGYRLHALADVCGMTIAAQLGSMPLAMGTFGILSLVGLPVSVVAMPLCALLCVTGILGGLLSIVAPGVSPFVVAGAIELADAFCVTLRWVSAIPYACIGVSWDVLVCALSACAVSVLLYMAWPRATPFRARLVVAGGLITGFLAVFVAPLLHAHEIVMIDVGQGDAFVLRSGAQTMLVDTGTNDVQIVQGLARHDVREVDVLVVTHPDDDHCGSFESVASCVPVRRIAVAQDLLTCSCEHCAEFRERAAGYEIEGLAQGDVIRWGAFSAQVLSPGAFVDEGGNRDSIVLLVEVDCNDDAVCDWSALMCGDAEEDTLSSLAARGSLCKVDILKVGHHGSKASLDQRVLDVLDPQLALVSVGARNRYGHPAPQIIELLNQANVRIARTDELGDVSCYLKSDRIDVVALR